MLRARPNANFPQEFFERRAKRLPHLNPAATVVFKTDMLRIFTAGYHALPDDVFRGWATLGSGAMFSSPLAEGSRPILGKAPAACLVTIANMAGDGVSEGAAITQKPPNKVSVSILSKPLHRRQPGEFVSRLHGGPRSPHLR